MSICIEKQLINCFKQSNITQHQYNFSYYQKNILNQYSLDELDSYNVYIENYGMIDSRIPNQFKKLITKKYGREVYFPFPKIGEPEKSYETKNGKCTFWTEVIDSITGKSNRHSNAEKTFKLDNPMVITFMKMDTWMYNTSPLPVCITSLNPFKTDDGEFIYHKKKFKSHISENWSDQIIYYSMSLPNYRYYFLNDSYDSLTIVKSGFEEKYLSVNNVMSALCIKTNHSAAYQSYHRTLQMGLDSYLPDLIKQMEKEKATALKILDHSVKNEAKQIGISLEEHIEQLELPIKLARQRINELKMANEASKEMKYLPELLLSIASLKDEIETTYNHFNNENSKMSFQNIESRLKRIKDMQRVLQSIRKEDKKKK